MKPPLALRQAWLRPPRACQLTTAGQPPAGRRRPCRTSGPGQLREQAHQLLARSRVLYPVIEAALADRMLSGPPAARQHLLRRSPYARLVAQMDTMPVIEQAKGIIMAQQRSEPDETFGLLRRASRRMNVPVRELAAQVVAKTVGGSAQPSGGGGRRASPPPSDPDRTGPAQVTSAQQRAHLIPPPRARAARPEPAAVGGPGPLLSPLNSF